MSALIRRSLAAVLAAGLTSAAARENAAGVITTNGSACIAASDYIGQAMPRGNVMLVYDANAAAVVEGAWRYRNKAAPPADSVIVVLLHARAEVVVAAVKDDSVCVSTVIPRPVWNEIERPLARPKQPRS